MTDQQALTAALAEAISRLAVGDPEWPLHRVLALAARNVSLSGDGGPDRMPVISPDWDRGFAAGLVAAPQLIPLHSDGDVCTGLLCGNPEHGWAATPEADTRAGSGEPRTEAGQNAQYTLCHFDRCAEIKGPNECDCGVLAAILSIENEAEAIRADTRAAEPRGIDVERLARAVASAGVHIDVRDPLLRTHPCESCARGVRVIVAEYERLAPEPAPIPERAP